LHKQITNRLLEPFQWMTTIVSATNWAHFAGLRVHKDAEPHFQLIARMAMDAREASSPVQMDAGEWHLPLFGFDGDSEVYRGGPGTADRLAGGDRVKVATARCARVSYLTHDGRRDVAADIALHDRLLKSGHWSPFEHCARAYDDNRRSGNFSGWMQYRKTFEGEYTREAWER
jgi:hypothetical protein